MPSTYTSRLRLNMQGAGDNNGTWGTILNDGAISVTDDAIAGYAQITLTSVNVTLTTSNGGGDQARMAFLEPIGSLTANVQMVIPSVSKGYWVRNSTTGAFAVSIGTLGTTGINAPQGGTIYVICNGSATTAAPDSFPGGVATPGAISVGSTLTVTGNTCLAGTANHVGAATFAAAVSTNSTLQTTGAIGTAGAASVGTTLDVTGATSLNSTLVTEGAATFLATLSVAGALTVGGATSVNGNTVLEGTLNVTGATSLASTLMVNGNVSTAGTLTAQGAVSTAGGLTVTGETCIGGTFRSLGTAIFGGVVGVSAALSVGSVLDVTGAVSTASTFTVNGATSATGIIQAINGIRFGTNTTDILNNIIFGTWTPTITVGDYTYGARDGRYQRMGNLVFINGNLIISAITSAGGTGNFSMGGLPLTVSNYGLNVMGGLTINQWGPLQLNVGYTQLGFRPTANTATFLAIQSGTSLGAAAVSLGAIGSTFEMNFTGMYLTSITT